MYILLWLWFILILLCIIAWVIFVAMYNTLIHLHTTCQNTAQDLCNAREHLWEKTTDNDIKTLISSCARATTLDRQVTTLNKLRSWILTWTVAEKKSYQDKEHTLQTEKRFFNNTARELADRLNSFPSNTIWSVFAIKAPKLLDLDDEAHVWILPEAKYL